MDLSKIGTARRTVERLLRALAEDDQPENLDVKALVGRRPWLRARAGDVRVIFRRLNAAETSRLGRGYLVARIVHRRDLERVVSRL